ncbi:glycosyltransferase family 4 protein [Acidipropionibacterium jensenii]|uniref:glycosyltransferase family 4 protein n=1 Tax=Acidipropionibacterium jensenii TaxID=1749 RepID=UPI00214CB48E|nr:glycosyltransferase family 4 protein [Acidipropionibacterium jensenii]
MGAKSFKPWARWDPRVKIESSLRALNKYQLGFKDVVVATSVETAKTAATIVLNHGCTGWYFLQHVETWSLGSTYLDETLHYPLHKVAVAPWIRDYCVRIGESCEVVLNAVGTNGFPLGRHDSERRFVSTLLSPGIPLKRTDLGIKVLNILATRDYPATAFGTGPRPRDLDQRVQYKRKPTHKELVSLYQHSRVFFCMSQSEGFGLTPAEATLCGSAIVSTNNGGVEAYAESFAKFTGQPNVERTVSAIVELMQNPAEANLRAKRGRRVLLSYPPEAAAKKFADTVLGVHAFRG